MSPGFLEVCGNYIFLTQFKLLVFLNILCEYMKKVLLTTTAIMLAGCATVTPQQAVNQLDQRGEKYETKECQNARQIALSYDDNVTGRMGIGMGLGLFLGPFGLPLAAMADKSQADKRNAVLAELKKHCEGPLPKSYRTGNKSDLQVRLDLLNELKEKGLLTEEEYLEKKKKLIE
jgi:hypothetical protein